MDAGLSEYPKWDRLLPGRFRHRKGESTAFVQAATCSRSAEGRAPK